VLPLIQAFGTKLTSACLCSTQRGTAAHRKMTGHSPKLLLEHFFDLPDLFFNFAGVFLSVAFGL
jgi:hypothetical protein